MINILLLLFYLIGHTRAVDQSKFCLPLDWNDDLKKIIKQGGTNYEFK